MARVPMDGDEYARGFLTGGAVGERSHTRMAKTVTARCKHARHGVRATEATVTRHFAFEAPPRLQFDELSSEHVASTNEGVVERGGEGSWARR